VRLNISRLSLRVASVEHAACILRPPSTNSRHNARLDKSAVDSEVDIFIPVRIPKRADLALRNVAGETFYNGWHNQSSREMSHFGLLRKRNGLFVRRVVELFVESSLCWKLIFSIGYSNVYLCICIVRKFVCVVEEITLDYLSRSSFFFIYVKFIIKKMEVWFFMYSKGKIT